MSQARMNFQTCIFSLLLLLHFHDCVRQTNHGKSNVKE